jgi:kynureninase
VVISPQTMVFPVLDRVRSGLGAAIDAERAHVKGKMMDEIIHAYLTSQGDNVAATNAVVSNIDLVRQPSKCPFGFSNDDMTAEAVAEEAKALSLSRASMHDVASNDTQHASLPKLYSWESTTTRGAASELRKHAAALRLPSHPLHPLGGPLSFLDHAWGQPSPLALQAALAELEGLYLLGNPSWNAVFGSIMPEAASHVARLLDIPEGAATVHFAHNSHELVTRVLSQLLLDRPSYTHACVEKKPLRVLTSDCEFYSVTRQLNRLTEAGAVDVCAVSTKPVESFSDRFISVASTAAAAGKPFDVVYVSQTTYLTQETLLPDVAAFVKDLHQACSGHANAASCDVEDTPLVMVDGYHAFAAFPVSLGPAAERCIYVAGLLKHAGCGANAAFATVPAWMTSGSPTPKLRPVFTGWLADPSVLASGSDGIAHGSYVGYDPAMTLQGATPAFLLPLLTWNHLQRLWAHITPRTLTVEDIHMHVLALQEELLAGLRQHGTHGLTQENLVPPSPERCRSHTLVFQQACSEVAKQVVEQLQAHGILVDCRKQYVRVGIGPNHTSADVRSLCMAVRAIM